MDDDFDRQAVTAAWDRLVTEYAGARDPEALGPYWTDLIVTATGADLEQVDDEVDGYAPAPAGPASVDDVVVEVMNGVSDIVVRLVADAVLYGDDHDAKALVAEARRRNDRYCDLYELVVARHPEAGLGDGDDGDEVPVPASAPATAPATAAVAAAGSSAGPASVSGDSPAPWLHRTGTTIDGDALGGLVKRLVGSYAARDDAPTLEAMWRSAFAASSGCAGEVVAEVCETARLPTTELPEARAANEVAAGFEELFGAAVVRLFAADSTGNGELAAEARRLVERRDALFDLMERLYPGMYDEDA